MKLHLYFLTFAAAGITLIASPALSTEQCARLFKKSTISTVSTISDVKPSAPKFERTPLKWEPNGIVAIPKYNLTFPELSGAGETLRKLKEDLSSAETKLDEVTRKLRSSSQSKDETDEYLSPETPVSMIWPFSLLSKSSSASAELSPEKKAELVTKKDELETLVSELSSAIETETQKLRTRQKAVIEKARAEMARVMRHPLVDSAVRDIFSYYSLSTIPKEQKVTILSGTREGSMVLEDPSALNHFKNFISDLKSKNYIIVFDGSTVLAPVIVEIAGKRAVPVFDSHAEAAQSSLSPNSISIVNDYKRMQIFAESKSVVITPDSVSGIGLILEGKATDVWNIKSSLKGSQLTEWESSLRQNNRNLGVNIPYIKRVENLYGLVGSSVSKPNEFLKFSESNITFPSFEIVLKEATAYAEVMNQNTDTGGAVFFGSSKHDRDSAPLIYESAYDLGLLGYAVATGGSGGAMALSNAGAYNGGGVSIGIPISGKLSLSTERFVSRESQTFTISTSDYAERIPALLGEGADARKLIVFAPGGNGTIKELATTFVRLTKTNHGIEQIIFLDKEYYERLVAWFGALPLPGSIKEKFIVTDSRSEVALLGKEFQNSAEADRAGKPLKTASDYASVSSAFTPSYSYSAPEKNRGELSLDSDYSPSSDGPVGWNSKVAKGPLNNNNKKKKKN